MSSAIKTILDNTRITDILPKCRELFYVDKNETLMGVFKKLTETHVSGVFVLDQQKAIGWVDLYDVVVCIVYFLNERGNGDVNSVNLDEIFASDEFQYHSASYVRNLSLEDEWVVVNWNLSVSDAVPNLIGHKHRVAVVDPDGKIVNVLSQLDIVVFLANCRDVIALLQVPIQNHPSLIGEDVVSHSKDHSMLSALLSCYNNGVNGLAVLDEHGKIVGNLSASDLVGITSENIILLSLSVHNYLIYEGRQMRPAVTVKATDTLEMVFLKIVAYKIHRVYVVDDNNTPIGVISLTDVIKLCVEEFCQ